MISKIIIDAHSYYFPLAFINETWKGTAFNGLAIIQSGGKELVCHRQGSRYTLAMEFYDLEAKLAGWMNWDRFLHPFDRSYTLHVLKGKN